MMAFQPSGSVDADVDVDGVDAATTGVGTATGLFHWVLKVVVQK